MACFRLSLSCAFRLLHTFHFLRPARHYPRVRIRHSSFERRRDFNPPERRAAQHTLRPFPSPRHGRRPFRRRWRRDLRHPGPPPITQTTFPACRAHYPGGPDRCTCRLLPCPRGLPRISGGSASATSLSRPAQASLTLRPTSLLAHHAWALLRGFDPTSRPIESLVSYQVLPTTTWVGPSPTSDLHRWGALRQMVKTQNPSNGE